MNLKSIIFLSLTAYLAISCQKEGDRGGGPDSLPFSYTNYKVDGATNGPVFNGTSSTPQITVSFTQPVDQASAKKTIFLLDKSSSVIATQLTFSHKDSTISLTPSNPLNYLSGYTFKVVNTLKSATGNQLITPVELNLFTAIDSTLKYQLIPNDSLFTLVQQRTFKYFWDFGHPQSGLARERNSSGDVVTSGGSGFGLMAIPVGVFRGFISRSDGLLRARTVVTFLQTKAQRYHGAFPHWLNGNSGITVPFSANDNGADLVETSYLMMGLLTLRQYFNGSDATETQLRKDINELWNSVEWDFFTRDGSNRLYWHWSPDKGWIMNMAVQGWNETLITYVLAASSTTHGIGKAVYDNGFARNGAMKNGGFFYGIQLPLGEALGGPLFFSHYSFLGINPKGLSDNYADYQMQVTNHTKINYSYCVDNPKKIYGYSRECWGLTASDISNGYSASSPTNDLGVIAPTAAISSLPFTPEESINAMRFFYYRLGNKLWGQYGFYDAFDLHSGWFADSFLAIDQGPQLVMIENYRSGLPWKLFMSCQEVKSGMKILGFKGPDL